MTCLRAAWFINLHSVVLVNYPVAAQFMHYYILRCQQISTSLLMKGYTHNSASLSHKFILTLLSPGDSIHWRTMIPPVNDVLAPPEKPSGGARHTLTY